MLLKIDGDSNRKELEDSVATLVMQQALIYYLTSLAKIYNIIHNHCSIVL